MNEETIIPNNSEIDKALKEFEAKQNTEQIQKSPEVSTNSEIPKIVRLVMKYSGVKEQKQAEYILFGFVIIALIISGFLFLGRNITQQKIPNGVLEEIKQMQINK